MKAYKLQIHTSFNVLYMQNMLNAKHI